MATATNDKPVRLGDLPVVKTNILENAGQMDKGVVGGYNGAFPLTAASEGGIYLLPSTGKFYVCETAYNGSQISAPNSNFVELSVWKNHDRLNKLPTFEFGKVITLENNVQTKINFKKAFSSVPIVLVSVIYGGAATNENIVVDKISTTSFFVTTNVFSREIFYLAIN